MTKVAVAGAFLLVNVWIYHFLGRNDVIPPRPTFDRFPLALGDWLCNTRERLDSDVEDQLGLTDYLVCDYRRGEPGSDPDAVAVYVGYNEAQFREGAGSRARSSIHPPEHCMPGSGWDIIASDKVTLDLTELPEHPAQVNRLIIAKGESRQLVYYWYQSGGRVVADAYQKLLYLFVDRLTRRRADGSLVRVTLPLERGGEARADQTFHEFVPLLAAALRDYIPR